MSGSAYHIIVMTRLTFREAQRRRLLWLGLALGLVFVGLFTLGFYFAFRDISADIGRNAELITTQLTNGFLMAGLYVINFLVIMVTVLTSVGAISLEIDNNTIHAIAAKPIRRWEIMIGKWLGHAIMISIYTTLLVFGLMLSVYVISGGYVVPNPLAGWLILLLEALTVLSLTLLGSSLMSTLANGVMVFMLYGVAFVGSWTEQIGALMDSQTAVDLGILSSLLIPSEALWRRAAYLMQEPLTRQLGASPFMSVSVPSPAFIAYGVVYAAGLLALATWAFKQRDF